MKEKRKREKETVEERERREPAQHLQQHPHKPI